MIGALTLGARSASAHEFRPCLLDLRDLGGGHYEVRWKAGSSIESAAAPRPVFPAHCHSADEAPESTVTRLDCGAAGLGGSAITIVGLGDARVDAVVRYSRGAGDVTTRVLRADAPSFTIPAPADESARPRLALAASYLRAGVDHILRGYDHLLFVLGLLLLVRRLRPLVRTITAFTAAHSLTLALAATGAVRVPEAPVEALIALSLLLLAAEIARPHVLNAPDAGAPLARRRPWAMAFAFGLLHGFGFAGALTDLGLPAGEIPLALFAFNVGVECGQIAFVLAALGVVALAGRAFGSIRKDWSFSSQWPTRAPAYLIGGVAAFWFFERLARLGS